MAPLSPRPALGPAGAGLAPPPGAAPARSRPINADPSSGHAHRGAGPHSAANECPWSVPRLCPAHIEPRKDLEGMVAVVAILGELVATVTAAHEEEWPLLYPESLHRDLRRLALKLEDTLDHIAVTFLCQALATLRATPRPTLEDVRTAERAWEESVTMLQNSWGRVYKVAKEIFKTLEDEDTAKATATDLARDLQDETPTSQGRAGDSLVAAAPQPSVALPSAGAALHFPVVATEAREEPVVATRRGQRVKEAQELMGRFLVACKGGTRFPWGLESWLEGLRDSEEWTEEESPDDPEAAVAKAKLLCGAEWLWEASAHLARRHLLGTLEDISKLVSCVWGGSGGPGGPRGRAVAERCQRAIEDIPRLLEDKCPWSVPRLCPELIEPRKDLEGVVAMVAILGELVATVTAPHRDLWPLLYPKSLHSDLLGVALYLRHALDHVTVSSLCPALATLRATPRPTWEDVRTVEDAWRESENIISNSWGQGYWAAIEIFGTLEDEDTAEATNKDPAKATTTGLSRDLQDETPPGLGTAGDSLVAAALQPSVALPSVVATLNFPVAATEAREEPMVATRQVGAATRSGQRMKEARELLERFSVACDEGTEFPWRQDFWLESFLESGDWSEEESSDDPETSDDFEAVLARAKVLCGAQWLWEASARLVKDHLLGIFGEIIGLLMSPCGGSGGPGGPGGRVVAEWCQRAIEDIPRLLGGQ